MHKMYFDNAATTRVNNEVANTALDVMRENYANPSSAHSFGLEAEHILKKSRAQVMEELGYTSKDGNLIFTSCGTEANNTAIFSAYNVLGKRKNNIVISDSEHPSVEMCVRELEKKGVQVRRIPTKEGELDLDFATSAIDDKTMLVSCMTVNNETGAVYDIRALDKIRKQKAPDAFLHTDAVQGFCKLPYSISTLGADLVSISAHKIYAPKGVGGLFVKKSVRTVPLLFGGGQENALRSGTENLPGIAAFGKACSMFSENKKQRLELIKSLNAEARKTLGELCPFVLFNSKENFAPHILSISVPGIRSEILLRYLSEKGIYVSAGSACSSKNADNRVLSNFGLDNKRADSTIRISFGIENTQEEIHLLAKALNDANNELVHTL